MTKMQSNHPSFSIEDLMQFLDGSPTAWQAVSHLKVDLARCGFIELSEEEKWKIEAGQRYFVTRNGSSICAFVAPKKKPKAAILFASHTDSPALKLKPHPEICKHEMILFGVEIYGSPLLSAWLNRDLRLAGRIIVENESGQASEILIDLKNYIFTIPQLALHLDREANERGFSLNKQEHLNVLIGKKSSFPCSALEQLLRTQCDFKQLLTHDLFFVSAESAKLIGYEEPFLSSARIDNLVSVHAMYQAIVAHSDPFEEQIKMAIFWDNEEIGSQTAQGAKSPFFNQVIERILLSYSSSREDLFCLLNRSLCLSIDLAHALHPSYPEKHDPNHQPILGGGIVIKHHAQHNYATNARSLFPLKQMAERKKLPLQYFVSRNDMPCGATVGPIQSCLTGIPTIDIGCGQLSMHSSRELIACSDYFDLCHLLCSFLIDWKGRTEAWQNL